MSEATSSAISALRRRLHRGLARARATNGHAPAPAPLPALRSRPCLERDGLDMANMRRLIAFGLPAGLLLRRRRRPSRRDPGRDRPGLAARAAHRLRAHSRSSPPACGGRSRASTCARPRFEPRPARRPSSTCAAPRRAAADSWSCTAPPDYLDDVEQIEVRPRAARRHVWPPTPRWTSSRSTSRAPSSRCSREPADARAHAADDPLRAHLRGVEHLRHTARRRIRSAHRRDRAARVRHQRQRAVHHGGVRRALPRAGDPINFVAHP